MYFWHSMDRFVQPRMNNLCCGCTTWQYGSNLSLVVVENFWHGWDSVPTLAWVQLIVENFWQGCNAWQYGIGASHSMGATCSRKLLAWAAWMQPLYKTFGTGGMGATYRRQLLVQLLVEKFWHGRGVRCNLSAEFRWRPFNCRLVADPS